MKILVALKQVPARDSQFRPDASGRWIDVSGLSYEINEPDAYALEEALRLKEKHGGEVIVVSAGPARVQQGLREALARGADRAVHVESDALAYADAFTVAEALAAAIRPEGVDLVLTGLQSDDQGFAQVGVVLAEKLGMPHATIIMEVAAEGGTLRVKRELEGQFFQWVTMPTPALLTIQSGSSKLRYATLMGIKKAKTKEIKAVPAEPPPPGAVLERLFLPERTKHTVMLEGSPAEQAAQLAGKLKHEVRVL